MQQNQLVADAVVLGGVGALGDRQRGQLPGALGAAQRQVADGEGEGFAILVLELAGVVGDPGGAVGAGVVETGHRAVHEGAGAGGRAG